MYLIRLESGVAALHEYLTLLSVPLPNPNQELHGLSFLVSGHSAVLQTFTIIIIIIIIVFHRGNQFVSCTGTSAFKDPSQWSNSIGLLCGKLL